MMRHQVGIMGLDVSLPHNFLIDSIVAMEDIVAVITRMVTAVEAGITATMVTVAISH